MYIMCTKCKDGIIAEIVGKSMIRIIKRKEDFHPIGVDVTGTNFDMIVSCTLCGNLEPVECVDGQITMDTLTTKEKKDANNGKEEPKPGDGNNEDPDNGQPNPGEPNAGEQPQLAIPKVETRGDKKPKEAFEVDTTAGIVSLDPMHNILNVEQAMAYIATQSDPRAALDTLRRNRQLDQVTDTYIAAMDAGVIEDTREKKD